jgi:hypothetical protein
MTETAIQEDWTTRAAREVPQEGYFQSPQSRFELASLKTPANDVFAFIEDKAEARGRGARERKSQSRHE